MAVNDFKAAAGDLDDAVSAEPQNLQAWTTRAFAYERLGDKEKAAGSYARALNINKDHEPAKQGFARVGGKIGPDLSDVLIGSLIGNQRPRRSHSAATAAIACAATPRALTPPLSTSLSLAKPETTWLASNASRLKKMSSSRSSGLATLKLKRGA